jgi:hypothetical protein
MARAKQRPMIDRDAAIVLGAREDKNATRWGMLLVAFMRIVGLMWIAQGLAQWHLLLTAHDPLFDHVSRVMGGLVLAFAVFNPLAGVGLWLAASWGGIVWLIAAMAQIAVAIFEPAFFSGAALVAVLDGFLIALYLFLTYRAGQEPGRPSAPRRLATRLWSARTPLRIWRDAMRRRA